MSRKRGNRNGKRSNARANRSGASYGVSYDDTEYTGPVRNYFTNNEVQSFTSLSLITTSATSSAGGVLNTVFSTNPSSTTQWSNLQAVFDEYRVLALEVEYVPLFSTLPSTLAGGTFIMVVDHDSAGSITVAGTAMGYESAKYGPIDRRLKHTFRMSGTLESNFINTSSPTGVQSVKTFATGLTASTKYGDFYARFLIQWRGKGV